MLLYIYFFIQKFLLHIKYLKLISKNCIRGFKRIQKNINSKIYNAQNYTRCIVLATIFKFILNIYSCHKIYHINKLTVLNLFENLKIGILYIRRYYIFIFYCLFLVKLQMFNLKLSTEGENFFLYNDINFSINNFLSSSLNSIVCTSFSIFFSFLLKVF